MPVWATIVLAIATTAAGAAVATYVAWMRINFEREESLRSRMLDAADDYSASVTRASNALHRALYVVPEEDLLDESGHHDNDSEEASRLRGAVDEARPLVDEARAHFTRVRLLYGTDSSAGQAALLVISRLTHVITVLDDFEVYYAQRVFGEATEAHDTFTREARRALLRPSLDDPPQGATGNEKERDEKAPPF